MRLTAYSIILFFVCLNVSLYIIGETEVLPYYEAPYVTPTGIETQLKIATLTTLAIVGLLTSALLGHLIYGAVAALLIWALGYLLPVVDWVFNGFPKFLAQMGVPTVIWVSINSIMAVVWFWFIMGFVTRRELETV